MLPALLLLVGVLLSVLTPNEVHAREYMLGDTPLRLDITSTTGGAWRRVQTNAQRGRGTYGELIERLNIGGSRGPWLAGLRVDTSTYFSTPTPEIRDRYTLEKVWVGWTGRTFEANAGDAYVSLGRGLTLSLRKVDELGVDTTLRGAKVIVHHGMFGATLLAGYANIQNVDEKTSQSLDDPYDLIAGGQTSLTLGPITFGGQGSAIAFRDPLGLTPQEEYSDRLFQYGPVIDAPRLGSHFGLYLEGFAQSRESPGRTNDKDAMGMYGAATVYAGPVTVLFEGKAYGKMIPLKPHLANPAFSSVAYNAPPTLERILQPLEHSQSEIYGGRTRVDWAFSPEFRAYLNYGQFRDEQDYADPRFLGVRRPGNIYDPYGGIGGHWNQSRSRASIMAGRRLVQLEHTKTFVRRDDHVQADIVQALTKQWSAEVHLIHAERKKHDSAILNTKFREGTLILNIRYQPYLGLSAVYDYTTDPTQAKVHYFNGNLDWDITPASSLRLFAGSQRGGLKCVSGVCRTVPPFEGVRLVATIRY